MIEKPKSKIIKDNKTKVNWKYFYHVLFVAVIIIEIYLIINEKNKIKENKIILQTNLNKIITIKNNISILITDNNELEKEICHLKEERINSLNSCKDDNENLKIINKNLSEKFNKNFEEYESREKIIEYKIIEDNETLNDLKNKLNNKTIIMKKLEKELDNIEEKLYNEIPYIKMKSSILESDEEKINLLTKWILSLNVGQIKKYELIFSAIDNNFDSFSFHELCSQDITNTLILIKTENNDIIGGFTFASWEPNSLVNYDDKAFIFNLNKKKKFRISNPSSAINSKINEGPIFGLYDLIINGNKMKVQEKMESYGDNDLGIGHEVINIVNYEVFNVIFS